MNYTAAQRFMTQTELFESLKQHATKVEGTKKATTTPQSSSGGLTVGQVIVFGLTVIVITIQLIQWFKQMEKILNSENNAAKSYSFWGDDKK